MQEWIVRRKELGVGVWGWAQMVPEDSLDNTVEMWSCMKQLGICSTREQEDYAWKMLATRLLETNHPFMRGSGMVNEHLPEVMLRCGMRDLSGLTIADEELTFSYRHGGGRYRHLLQTWIERGASLQGKDDGITFRTWPIWLLWLTNDGKVDALDETRLDFLMETVVAVERKRLEIVLVATGLISAIVDIVIASYDETEFF